MQADNNTIQLSEGENSTKLSPKLNPVFIFPFPRLLAANSNTNNAIYVPFVKELHIVASRAFEISRDGEESQYHFTLTSNGIAFVF